MMKVIVGTQPKERPGGPDYFLQNPSGAAASMTEDLEWEKVSIEEVLAMATTMSLMGDMGSFRFSGALSGTSAEDFLDIAKDLAASPHQFIFTEEKLLKKVTDNLTKAGAQVVVYPTVKKDSGKEGGAFDVFSLTYAFAARDRKKLWLLYNEALRADVVPEAIAGILHWKVRDMVGKGERGKYSKEELQRISSGLVGVYHDSHRGAGELSLLLERYILLL